MTDFLEQVVAERRERVVDILRPMRRALEERSAARRDRPRDFAAALRERVGAGHVAVIAEVKRRSPSTGELARIPDAATLALYYALGGAAAISVLTEERHFGGSVADLARVRESVRVPVLRKDFIVDELQLVEAHAHGADAVLLIADALETAELRALLDAATALGLGVLLEAHEEDALERAIATSAPVIGINQRDLRSLELESDTVARLASRVPADRVLVAESGIAHASDVRALPSRVDAVLVGTALIGLSDPHERVRELAAVTRERTPS